MNSNYETSGYDPKKGFTFDEYDKYDQLSFLLKKYCNHINYRIYDVGVLKFKSKHGTRYELFWKPEEVHIPGGRSTFGTLYRYLRMFHENCRYPYYHINEPMEIIHFILCHN